MASPKRLRARQGIRLWTAKQAPYLQGDDSVPTWPFDPDNIVFTPAMAKRVSPARFATAPIIQGKWDSTGTGDLLAIPRGSQIVGNFYSNFDPYQGAISFFVIPEWDGDDGLVHYFYDENNIEIYKSAANNLQMKFRGSTAGYPSIDISSWTAGSKYHVVMRWDTKNTLDGTNYSCVSINDVHQFNRTGTPPATPVAPASLAYLASEAGATSGNCIPDGFTIWRRPLWDGAYGIDAGNNDEINRIWNNGSGTDPSVITGSWDICFCLPTNSSPGEIVTGTGEAWSHPHGSNLLGIGGFMMDGTYTNDGWADEGSPTAVAALATAEKIYNRGYKVISDAANEGIYKDYTCSAGDDFVIRAIGHSDGTSIPKAILYDQTNTTEIGSLTGSNASTRTAPDVFIFTGTAPAGCTTLRVKLINTDATTSDITYWHQCELLANLIPNPSFEAGAGDPWIPTGWTNDNLDPGDTEAEGTIVHSGANSMQWNAGANSSSETIYHSDSGGAAGDFFCYGAWLYGDGSNGLLVRDLNGVFASQYLLSGVASLYNSTAAWVHSKGVYRRITGRSQRMWTISPGIGPVYVDDIYIVALDAVSLTITPASEANSQEINGIRVDGLDGCSAPIPEGELGAKSGKLWFNWTPRHGDGDFEKFWTASYVSIFFAYANYDNRLLFYSDTNDVLRFHITSTGGGLSSGGDTWDAAGITADVTYLVEIQYDSTSCTLSINGVIKMTATPGGGIDFGTNIPTIAYMGTDNSGIRQGDAVFSAWYDVAIPDAGFSWVPFTVQSNGLIFRPDPSFDLQTHAGISVSKTYYVDRSIGDDGNTGADWDNALKTLNEAWGKGDVDRVYVRNSVFFLDECNHEPTRDVETIGIGDNVHLTSNVRNDAGPFTEVDNHFEADFGSYRYIASVYDETQQNVYGNPAGLSKKTDIDTVDSTPNSWFFDYQAQPSNTLYIRTHDGRPPDDSMLYHEAGPFSRASDNQTLYLENLTFHNSATFQNASATAGSLFCLKNCRSLGISVRGTDVIFQDCVFGKKGGGDIININAQNGVVARVIEIDLHLSHIEYGGSSDQASTGHNACLIVRLNSTYYAVSGQVIADVGGCQSWLLGGRLYQPGASNDAYYQDGDAWLHGAYLDGDLVEGGSGTIHIRNCIITGSQSGDIQSY